MPHADPVKKSEAADSRRTRAERIRAERRQDWAELVADPDPYDQDNDFAADR